MLLAFVPTPGRDKDLLHKEIEVPDTIIFFFEASGEVEINTFWNSVFMSTVDMMDYKNSALDYN